MIEVLKQAYQLLLTEPHAPTVCNQLEVILRQAIAELESQEPVAKLKTSNVLLRCHSCGYSDKLTMQIEYTHPPQRTAQEWFSEVMGGALFDFQEATGCDTAEEFKAQRTEQEPLTRDLSHIDRLTHTKTKGIIEQHKYNITGFVLTNDDGKKCISDMTAVRWFEGGDFFAMMHSTPPTPPAQPPQRTEPIQSLQCFHCQVTIETLNDKVMHLMEQRTWVGLTDVEAQWLYDNCRTPSNLIDMVEAKLKELNT